MSCAPSATHWQRPGNAPDALAIIDALIAAKDRMPASPAALAEVASRGMWVHARHLDLLDRKLVDLAEGRIKRLIVTMPPRHGKSKLCSEYFPAWYLGTNPDRRVILCSYEANFAAEWGSRARDVLAEYGLDLFGVTVREDKSARDDWQVAGYDGGMVTAGVGGAITGRGANLLIIDDPVKNAEEADSEIYREKVWRWWTSTAYTRIEPNGSALLIMTRWHDDDLAGRLLKQDQDEPDGEPWERIDLPAVAEEPAADVPPDAIGREPGEALWPARWPLQKLLAIAKRVGRRVWSALFQQRPQDVEGGFFKRAWFSTVEKNRIPKLIDEVRQWDLAATTEDEATDPDWLVGVRMGRSEDGRYYVTDVIRERVSPANVERIIRETAAMDGKSVKVRIEQEGAASGKIVAYIYPRMLPQYDARFKPVAKSSKAVRAGPYSAALERQDVFLQRAEWNADFIHEHLRFPTGAHDDQVDAASGAYESINKPARQFTGDDWKQVASYTHEDNTRAAFARMAAGG